MPTRKKATPSIIASSPTPTTTARTLSSSPPDSSTPLTLHSKPSNYPSPTARSSNATAPTTKKPNTTTKSSPSSTSTPTSSSLHKTKAASFRTPPLYLLLFYVDLATDIQSEFISFSESLTIFFGREVKLRMCLVCCSRNPISEIL